MADWNRVTERGPRVGSALWLVSAEWRGGHDNRVIRLDNIHQTEAAAQADWERLTPENHNAACRHPAWADCGFVRHPIRMFVEQSNG